jgi:transposase
MLQRERQFYTTNYATDVTDEPWAVIALLVTTVLAKGGRPPEIDLWVIVTAVIDQNRTGCQGRFLPADSPPMGAVRHDFDK